MPPPPFIPVFLFCFILASSLSSATATAKPTPLLFPIKKDASTNQCYTTLQLGTPPTAMNDVEIDCREPTSPTIASPPFIPLFLFGFILAFATATAIPAPLVFPVKKDNSTNRYYVTLQLGTPPTAMNAVLDLRGQFTWLNCSGYKSSSFRHVPCNSSRCDVPGGGGCINCSYGPSGTTCTNSTCGVILATPSSDLMTSTGLGEDVLVLQYPKGIKHPSRSKFQQFPFTCAESFWAENLPESAQGMVALARYLSSLAARLPSQLNLARIFALCLPSSSSSSSISGHGDLYVGGRPYTRPSIKQDLAKLLHRTQLLISPGSIAPVSSEGDGYTINVTAIKVNFAQVTFNSSVLQIDKDGFGGATINPLNPYMLLHSEIFTPLVKEFTKEAKDRKIKKATPVAPFGVCFNAKTVKSGLAGPDMPTIVLVLRGAVQWRIEGANSMVRVNKDVMCLGFLDGGSYGMGAMVIGGHQIEDNLVEFDVGLSTFGFGNSLLLQNSSCSHF
ncbi:probable aspartic proteinase GIP2 [Syzygium oleosum]|uniref:probable aspartic proteinase GIP2 n=1 Tax=Syzygium oleosum TaxID=219896 RepID=UPI0024B95AA1|nr:probable aspartic proteinase GIP2 [Syzygium oleosum]